jgi:AraC family transcriptional regulator
MSSMDPTYFHKLFTRTFGVTPARRVLMWRIAAARMALTDRDLSLAEIAQMCGFASQSYFSTCFRQKVGKTPRTYRAEKLDESAK